MVSTVTMVDPQDEVARPFKTLRELYSNINSLVPWTSAIPLRKTANYVYKAIENDVHEEIAERIDRKNAPKTLVCHDMMGGYLEDKYINGSNIHKSYHFYQWNIIDTFVYFSHYLITIPPIGWINAAHSHGVDILGTLITEANEGKAVWEEVLKTIDSTTKFADALITLAQFYKFDGWLLNVENELTQNDVSKLTFFVQYLTERMHKTIKDSKVIWYDSITNAGHLHWQNELNDKNDYFFNCCDGIFLNYTWTDSGLKKSVSNAKERVKDVYVGLDVWGRGCPGGGGFNSAYALEKIRSNGLSVAIFAPGWTFEYFGSELFPKLENIFWAQLMPFLYIHVPLFDNEQFVTTFCRGVGLKYYEYGMEITFKDPSMREAVEKSNSFYNMSMQRHQNLVPSAHLKFKSVRLAPSITNPLSSKNDDHSNKKSEDSKTIASSEFVYNFDHEIMRVNGKKVTFQKKSTEPRNNYSEFSYDISYEGGGCLKLVNNDIRSYHRLFFAHIEFIENIQARIIYRTLETPASKNQQNSPVLLMMNSKGKTSFLPKETIHYGLGWKMSIFQTNMNVTHEVGIAFSEPGSCFIGKLVLEEMRHPHRLYKRQKVVEEVTEKQ